MSNLLNPRLSLDQLVFRSHRETNPEFSVYKFWTITRLRQNMMIESHQSWW